MFLPKAKPKPPKKDSTNDKVVFDPKIARETLAFDRRSSAQFSDFQSQQLSFLAGSIASTNRLASIASPIYEQNPLEFSE